MRSQLGEDTGNRVLGNGIAGKKSPEARKTMSCSRTRKVRVAREMGEEGGRNRAVRGRGSMCHDTKPVNALKIIKCL